MDTDSDQRGSDSERVTRLGTSLTEQGAHIIASVVDGAGIRVRVAGAPTLGSRVFAGSQYSIEVLVFERDYAEARALVEALPGQCMRCNHDLTGLSTKNCPECGADLSGNSTIGGFFKLAPPPGSGRLIQLLGAALGAIILIAIAALLIGAVITGAFSTP